MNVNGMAVLAFVVCGLTCMAIGALAIAVCEGRRLAATALAVVVAAGIWLTFFIIGMIPHR